MAHRVVVAGGGVAGLEALLALHALAGQRVEVALVDPARSFALRALSVGEPFAAPRAHTYDLDELCEDHGARHVSDTLEAVGDGVVTTGTGEELPFDSLLVALGVRREPALDRVLTFRDARDAERVHGLVQDIEGGYLRHLAFVVPPGPTWPLPLYEIALLSAERASSLGLDALRITLLTPERRPLDVFGAEAADAVEAALEQAGIVLHTGAHVAAFEHGTLRAADGAELAEAQRVVALPLLVAPRIAGLPADADGFLPTDEHARVEGLEGVYGAGDGTSQPVKQGGVAAQQGGTAARHIAARAGADVSPQPFQPILRAQLFTGRDPLFLRRTSASGPTDVSEHALWWPPTKVMAPHLAAYLEHRETGHRGPARAPGVSIIHGTGDPAGPIELLGD